MISVLGDAQQLKMVDEYLKRMDDEGIDKDTYTFSAAITACERSMEWQKALNLFDSMAEQGVKANVVTLNAVLNACVKGRKWRLAMDKLAEACHKKGLPVEELPLVFFGPAVVVVQPPPRVFSGRCHAACPAQLAHEAIVVVLVLVLDLFVI